MTPQRRLILGSFGSPTLQLGVTYAWVFSNTDKSSAIQDNAINVNNTTGYQYGSSGLYLGTFKNSFIAVPSCGWNGALSALNDINVNAKIQGAHLTNALNRRFRLDVPNGIANLAVGVHDVTNGTNNNIIAVYDGPNLIHSTGAVNFNSSGNVMAYDGSSPFYVSQTNANFFSAPNQVSTTISQGYLQVGCDNVWGQSRFAYIALTYTSFS